MSKSVAVVLVFAFFFSCSFVMYEQLTNDTRTQTIIVEPNDTLWEIAEKLNYNQDVGYVVQKIQELNGLEDCNIYPGQELVVPDTGAQLLGLTDSDDSEL